MYYTVRPVGRGDAAVERRMVNGKCFLILDAVRESCELEGLSCVVFISVAELTAQLPERFNRLRCHTISHADVAYSCFFFFSELNYTRRTR